MTPETVVDIIRQTLTTAMWLCAPLLLVGFVAGVIISLVQVLTSMQDSGFSTVPRLAAFLGALLVALPWMVKKLMVYSLAIFGDFGRYAR